MTNLKRHIGLFLASFALLANSAEANAPKPIIKAVENNVTISNFDKRQIDCIATNIYKEAGNQSLQGKIAVGNVVMNRVQHPKFPKTPCGVIHQKSGRTCQFSWVCQNKSIKDFKLYSQVRDIAVDVYYDKVPDVTKGALYFHARSVKPNWGKRLTVRIDDHLFYRG